MTFIAIDIFVTSIKFKSGLIVVKLFSFPVLKTMTGYAIGSPICGKLSLMNIRVTAFTSGFKLRKNLNRLVGYGFFEMTTAGFNCSMLS